MQIDSIGASLGVQSHSVNLDFGTPEAEMNFSFGNQFVQVQLTPPMNAKMTESRLDGA
jgi:hypothetical protein